MSEQTETNPVLVYMSVIGKRGGKAKSAKKKTASIENLKRAFAARGITPKKKCEKVLANPTGLA